MQLAVLGPLAVRDGNGRPVEVAGARLRCLLTRLALDAGRPVAVPALVHAVWADDPPAEQANALQTLVSRVRRVLGAGAVLAEPAGYRLDAAPEDVDARRFELLVRRGSDELHAGDPGSAAATLAEALGLWRGAALSDALAANDTLVPVASRLDDLRLSARIDRAQALVELAEPAAPAELELLVAEHPLHERLAWLYLRALAADGRQADALLAYERLRVLLADELGVDPSAELRQLHAELLNGTVAARPHASTRRTNLRAQLTSFVGRDDDVARIAKALEENRLVTLVGPGGAGKTRLAAESAAGLLEQTRDGVWLAELAPVTSGGDVAQAVADAVGVHETSGVERRKSAARDALTRLIEALADQQAVLVVDNCEHLIEAIASLVDQLLARCPGVRVLATSREPLAIVGEVVLPVPPLTQPDPGASAEVALGYPAVRLFADRSAAVRPGFVLDERSTPVAIEIVRRLDGLPLAIELAAARVRTLSLEEIAERLGDRFRLLTGGSRTALPRHRTLRAVVEWSWELLTEPERELAEQLAVFPAGVTVDSAAAVAQLDRIDAADLLSSLVDKSLLQRIGDGRRLRMLETIREYGVERLAERGTLAAVRRRHATHFAAVMAEAESHLTGADQLPWFDLARAERENIVSALRHLCELGEVAAAVRLGISLSMLAMMLGMWDEISSWLADVAALHDDDDPEAMLLVRALVALGWTVTGDTLPEVESARAELTTLSHELAELPLTVSPWLAIIRPMIAFFSDEPELAEQAFRSGYESPDEWTRAAVLMFRAALAENEGDVEAFRADTEHALEVFTRLGERWGMANSLRSLAQVLTLEGRLDEAVETYHDAIRLSAELHSREDEGYLHGRLADLELRRGNVPAAREHVDLARVAAHDHGSPMEELFALAMLSAVELASGRPEAARVLHRDAMQRMTRLPVEHPAHGHIRAMTLASAVRFAIADGVFTEALELGRESYPIAIATRDMPVVATVGVFLAELAGALGDPRRAARMLGASAALRGSEDATSLEIMRLTASLSDQLGAAEFGSLFADGRALDRDAALQVLDPSTLPDA